MTAALTALVLLVLPARALAAGWTPPLALPEAWGQASIAFDGTGVATVGHTDYSAPSRVGIALRGLDGSFTDQLTLTSTPGDRLYSVTVAEAPSGAATACIVSRHGLTVNNLPARFQATYRTAGSTAWEPPVVLATNPTPGNLTESYRCQTAVAPDGTASIVYAPLTTPHVNGEADVSQVRLATRRLDGTWTVADLSPLETDANTPRLAVDGAGTANVVWTERYAGGATTDQVDDKYALRLRTRSASGTLSPVVDVVSGGDQGTAYDPKLGLAPDGRAVVCFLRIRTNQPEAWAAPRDSAGGAFSAPTSLVPFGGSGRPVAAGVAPDGTAYVLSDAQQASGSADDRSRLVLARRPAGGSFAAGVEVSDPGVQAYQGAIAFLGDDAFAVSNSFQSGDLDGRGPFTATRWATGAPDPDLRRDLLAPLGRVELGEVLDDHDGSLAVLHTPQGDAIHPQIVAYDGGAPKLAAATVPAQAVVGTATPLSATFADSWSALEPTTWDFGDGTAGASGTAVTHTWASTGSYKVTARGRDVLGNARTTTFPVSVVVAPPTPPAPPSSPSPGPGVPPPRTDGFPARPLDRTAPKVTISLPRCPKRLTRAACTKRRKALASWRTVRGTAKDAGGIKTVTLTAKRARRGKVKARSVRATAVLKGPAWSAHVKGLGRGHWAFTAVATDRAGNRSKPARRVVTLRR